ERADRAAIVVGDLGDLAADAVAPVRRGIDPDHPGFHVDRAPGKREHQPDEIAGVERPPRDERQPGDRHVRQPDVHLGVARHRPPAVESTSMLAGSSGSTPSASASSCLRFIVDMGSSSHRPEGRRPVDREPPARYAPTVNSADAWTVIFLALILKLPLAFLLW